MLHTCIGLLAESNTKRFHSMSRHARDGGREGWRSPETGNAGANAFVKGEKCSVDHASRAPLTVVGRSIGEGREARKPQGEPTGAGELKLGTDINTYITSLSDSKRNLISTASTSDISQVYRIVCPSYVSCPMTMLPRNKLREPHCWRKREPDHLVTSRICFHTMSR